MLGEPVTQVEPVGAASTARGPADAVTTEIIRHGLNAAADQMQLALCRTAFSPIIYELLDLCCALYDREVRLLAQGKSLPAWLGTMNMAIESMVQAVGGPDALEPGDVLFSTYGYEIGSHPQDSVTVVPVFLESELVAYAAVKAHQMDIGAKEIYCADTTDNFQEGTIFPGVRLYRAGVLQQDLWRTLLANSRMPAALEGDLHATIAAAETGAANLVALISKHGRETFAACVERMFEHGEATVRRFLEEIPDGRYLATGALDSCGTNDDPVPYELTIEVTGSDIVVDFSSGPEQVPGPTNTPRAMAVSIARYSMMFLAGGGARESVNEGHLRPIAVRTRPGTIFDATPPAPIFLYNMVSRNACDAILRALAEAVPRRIMADSGGCLCPVVLWGTTSDGQVWGTGNVHVCGQGANAAADAGAPLMHINGSGVRSTPCEVLESRFPLVVRKLALAQDSAGAGRHRGGLGVDVAYEMLDDAYCTAVIERSKTPPTGLFSGQGARPNRMFVHGVDGDVRIVSKVTALPLPKGTVIEVATGGGGGYGPAREREPAAVERDLREGYVSLEGARAAYPHAVEETRDR